MLYLWCNKSLPSVDEWENCDKCWENSSQFSPAWTFLGDIMIRKIYCWLEEVYNSMSASTKTEKIKKDQAKCNFCGSFWTDMLRKLNKTVKILQVKGQCNGKLTVPFSEQVWLWSGLIMFVAPEDAAQGFLLVDWKSKAQHNDPWWKWQVSNSIPGIKWSTQCPSCSRHCQKSEWRVERFWGTLLLVKAHCVKAFVCSLLSWIASSEENTHGTFGKSKLGSCFKYTARLFSTGAVHKFDPLLFYSSILFSGNCACAASVSLRAKFWDELTSGSSDLCD